MDDKRETEGFSLMKLQQHLNLQDVLDCLPHPVLLLDDQGRLQLFNAYAVFCN
ncbi:MAG: hypothetical protein GX060_04605 [Firmicutes bacterium]|nr:hypothetical protein [Bacillota bacterium]